MNASGVASYAMHKANLVQTVAEYNAAAEAGTGADLTPERVTYPCQPIVEPPFYALPIRNAIFATFGGVAINEKAQVLDGSRRPIAGLYATEPPPFYALPIRNAIFATFGGVAINEKAQVLDGSRRPIAGLYATEPCAGGMMQEFYAGSIAHAGVTGFWAADCAAEALKA